MLSDGATIASSALEFPGHWYGKIQVEDYASLSRDCRRYPRVDRGKFDDAFVFATSS